MPLARNRLGSCRSLLSLLDFELYMTHLSVICFIYEAIFDLTIVICYSDTSIKAKKNEACQNLLNILTQSIAKMLCVYWELLLELKES